VAHAYNLSYLGGLDQEDHSSRPAQAKSSQEPISKLSKEKWTGGVAEVIKCLLWKYKTLSLNHSPTKKKKKKKLYDYVNRCWKSIWQNLTPTHDKNSQQTSNRELSWLDKEWLFKKKKKSYSKITLNGEKLEGFPLRWDTRKECPSCNSVLEVLANAIRQEKDVKRIQIWKEEIKLSLFAHSIIYGENSGPGVVT
jgi:hypothetical protein